MASTTPYDVFRLYLGIKTHFGNKNYDFFKYAGKVSATPDAFEQRNDRYFFVKLAKKFPNKVKLTDYLVANILDDKIWIGDLNDDSYTKFLKRKESLAYVFDSDVSRLLLGLEKTAGHLNDLFVVPESGHPPIIKALLSGEICIETVCILNSIIPFVDFIDKRISDHIIWPVWRQKIKKLTPFLKMDLPKLKASLKKKVLDI